MRLRAPLAVAALLALTLVAAARIGLGVSELVTVDGSRAVAGARLAPNGSDGALTVLAGLLVVACFRDPGPPARRRLAVWGAVLCAVSLLASVAALATTNLAIAGWNVVWLIPDLVVPVLVGLVLVVLVRSEAVVAGGAGVGEGAVDGPVPDAPAEDGLPPAGTPASEPDPALEPAWTTDAAAGAVWRTAGEAASGAPASAWGSTGPTGWEAPATSAPEDHDPYRRPEQDRTR